MLVYNKKNGEDLGDEPMGRVLEVRA